MYQYKLYDLHIHSDIILYNLPETRGKADAFIKYATVTLPEESMNSKDLFFTEQYACLKTPSALIVIQNGSEILIDITGHVDENELASVIIGWAIAYLFTQRGHIALHSTALDIEGKGVLISGISGAGKSTTALSLISKGYKYLTDDVTIINPENMTILPAYPLQKVCQSEIHGLQQDRLLYINEAREKYSYYNPEQFCNTPRKIHTIILLDIGDNNQLTVVESTGLDRYLNILSCQYLAEIYRDSDTPASSMFRCLQIAGSTRLHLITRPRHLNTINSVSDRIIDIISKGDS